MAFRARFPTGDARPWRWDPETGTRSPYPFDDRPDSLWIRLEHSESLVLVFESGRSPLPDSASPRTALPSSLRPREWLTLAGEWDVRFHHWIEGRAFERRLRPLEDLSLSPDPELVAFAGTAVYRTSFTVPDERNHVLDLGPVNGVSAVRVSGRSIGVRWW